VIDPTHGVVMDERYFLKVLDFRVLEQFSDLSVGLGERQDVRVREYLPFDDSLVLAELQMGTASRGALAAHFQYKR
jgi:hypothetical protein